MQIASMLRRTLLAAAGAFLLGAAVSAAPVEGRNYTKLAKPQPPQNQRADRQQIEVIEFFSWGCPHCYHLHPMLDQWVPKLAQDVSFMRVPVSMGYPQWGQLVRTYYTLEAMGELARLDGKLFDAIHKEKKKLFDEGSITNWVATQGLDAAKFRETFNSLNVTTRATNAEKMSRDYQVDGIPQIVVDGKYIVLGQDFPTMLANADQLIEKARAER